MVFLFIPLDKWQNENIHQHKLKHTFGYIDDIIVEYLRVCVYVCMWKNVFFFNFERC